MSRTSREYSHKRNDSNAPQGNKINKNDGEKNGLSEKKIISNTISKHKSQPMNDSLINNILDYFKEIKKQKEDDEENRLLTISYLIDPNKNISKEERLHKHEGISCSKCKIKNIKGNRYMCKECPYYNLCFICEFVNYFDENPHEHDFIKIRDEKDLNKIKGDYRFKMSFNKNEISMTKNDVYELNFENIGEKDWPKETLVVCLKDNSDCEFDNTLIGKVESHKKKSVNIKMKNMKFTNNICHCIFTLKAKERNNRDIKFLFPSEINIIKSK
jgi:hypothetical protein